MLDRCLKGLAVASLALLAGIAAAANPYTAPRSDREQQQMLEELQTLTERARRDRAADPWLQNALDDFIAKHYRPWSVSLVDESFRDGDFTRNPGWEVRTGRFWVDGSLGLRSQADVQPAAVAPGPGNTGKPTFNDLLMAMIAREMQNGQSAPPPPPQGNDSAVIFLPVESQSSFALDLTFSQHRPGSAPSRFEVGMLEGARRAGGYMLTFRLGDGSTVELRRVRNANAYDGTQVLKTVEIPRIPVGTAQALSWRRDGNGLITVALNGRTLFTVVDRDAPTQFRRVAIANRGGDIAVRRVQLATAVS